MKVTTLKRKLYNRSSTSFKKHGYDLIFLALIIIHSIESTTNLKASGSSHEAKLWKNRTQLEEARNLFSKYDEDEFNEADYVDSYDTWVGHGAINTSYSSYISQLREMNDNFNNNETLGMTKEQRDDVSSFFDLVDEYEDIKNDLQAKMKSMESESDFMLNHPLLPKRRTDVAQNMESTDSPFPFNMEVSKTQLTPYGLPDSSQSLNQSSLFDNMDSLTKYENRSVNFYSSKFKEYILNFGKNPTRQSYNSSLSISTRGKEWITFTPEEKDVYLERVIGPQEKYGKNKIWIPTIFYSLVSILGIPGNMLTCMTILSNSYMRTTPNFFILNLAIADMITLLGVVPMEIILFWKNYPMPLGDAGCDLAIVISELVTYVSILTMIGFTIERYLAICHSQRPNLHIGKRRTLLCIISMWLCSLFIACCWTHYSKVMYIYYHPWKREVRETHELNTTLSKLGYSLIPESAVCMRKDNSLQPGIIALEAFTTIVLYLLPIIILPAVYTRISSALSESRRFENPQEAENNPERYGNLKSAIRMQMAVFICFLIFWTPHHIQRIMSLIVTKLGSWTTKLKEIQEILHLIAGCCYLLNPAINPFLYSVFSKRFRRALFDLLLKSNIRCFNKNNNEVAATASSRRRPSKPFKQVISRRAMLRHFDLKSSNGISKPSIAKNIRSKKIQENQCGKDLKTSKTQSLHYFNDCNDIPSSKLYSEPILCPRSSNILNEDINLKKVQTSINLKSGDRTISFQPTPALIDESSEYQTCKIVPSKEKQNDYIYKVVFQASPSKRINVH